LAVLLCACGPPTQLVVVCDTDLEPTVEVASIEITASGPDSLTDRRTFDLDHTELPFSLGVAPARRTDELVHITATAFALDGSALVRNHIETHFLPGESRVVELPLARACRIEEPCHDHGLRCVGGECVSIEVEASALPVHDGSAIEPLFDMRVAPDAGPDAGPPCVEGVECTTGNPCERGEQTCGAEPVCEVVSTLAAGTDCGEGRTCDAEGTCAP
jgi:hypothetical protein